MTYVESASVFDLLLIALSILERTAVAQILAYFS
jgi:hypothetical protein